MTEVNITEISKTVVIDDETKVVTVSSPGPAGPAGSAFTPAADSGSGSSVSSSLTVAGTAPISTTVSGTTITVTHDTKAGTGTSTNYPGSIEVDSFGHVLGVGTTAPPAQAANNLSDLASAATALTNLGGTTVGKAVFVAADAAAARTAIGAGTGSGDLLASNNLSEVTDSTARTNLGLGNAAILDTGVGNTDLLKCGANVTQGDFLRINALSELVEGRTNAEVLSDIGAAAASHNHAAGDITSGTLAVARIPDISTDKLTSGTLAVARGGTGLTSLSTLLNSNQAYSDISGTPTLGTAAPLAVGISNNNVLQADANVADDDFLRVAGTQIEGRTAAQTLGDIGAQAALTFGKSSGNSIKSEAALDTNDFLRVGTTHVVGRTNAEVLSDIGAAAAAHTHTDSYAMFIVAPADKASPGFVVDGRVASARTITNFYAKTSGGTCTVTLRNVTDSVDIGAVSASSTGQSAGSLSNTSVAAAERLGIVITSNSSAADLELVVEYTA